MTRKIGFFFVALLLTAFGIPANSAEPAVLEASTAYNSGYHLFFNGQFPEAQQMFEQARGLDENQPLYCYYLGLSLLRQGREAEGTDFLRMAAQLEQTPEGRLIDVGTGLERIQGAERLSIEKIRKEARLQWQEKEKARQKALYGETLDRQKERISQGKANLPEKAPKSRETEVTASSLGGIPNVPSIAPLSRPEIDGSLSPDLAEWGKTDIVILKDEVGKSSLSTSAQKRRKKRENRVIYANPMDRPAADGSKFVDIYSSGEVSSDGEEFFDPNEPEEEPEPVESAESPMGGIGGLTQLANAFSASEENPKAVDLNDTTENLFGEEKPANPFADKQTAGENEGGFDLFENDKKFTPTK